MDAAVKRLFADYEKAFAALDIEKQVPLFAESFLSAGPKGTIAQSRKELASMAKKAAAFYRKVGQTGAKMVSITETPISDQYSFVDVHWAATFEKLGDKSVEFDVTYVLQKTDPDAPKIILFIAHQDEEQAMRDLGLVSEEAA
jgi:hypothetical protein